MVARSKNETPGRVIAPEIAERYGRELSTVQRQWMASSVWPAAVGKRGRWNVFDADAVDRIVREHFIRPTATAGRPDDLLTVAEIAEYTGLSASTIRSDISRGRIQRDPDDESDGVKRWRRATIDAAMAGRQRYRHR
jgi:predicted DNA-binding transcriptional regulator AlpA